MNDLPDPTSIASWPAAFVACVLIIAVLVVPAVLNYLSTKTIKTTLTTNNGGSTVKDQLDRIEQRLAAVEANQTVPPDAPQR